MGEARHGTKKRKSTLSLYISSAFVLTAAMTVLITACAIMVGWNVSRTMGFDGANISIALIGGAALALVVSGCLGLFFANGIAQPIARIAETAGALKDGDLTARTGLHGDDELSQLGESFDAMADSIERDRDLERQLIGDVAHELRTPLMAIQATVEAMQDGVFPADEEHLDTVSSETRRLGRLVDALLHLDRLENGTTAADLRTLDLSDALVELALTHEALLETAGLTLVPSIEEDVMVEGDRDLLVQAVSNLLANAARYTPEGGAVRIGLQRVDGYAEIAVSDTGIGIDEADMDKVFSRFWRADHARSGVAGGLGIGLAVVREVADQHKGSVGVHSVLGEGSTFYMRIPLSDKDPTLDEDAQREAKRMDRAERKETDRLRKEEEKLRKLEERQFKQERKEAEKFMKEAEKLRKQEQKGGSPRTVLGIRMPRSSKRDGEDGGDDAQGS